MTTTNFINYLKKPTLWIYISVIYIWILAIGKLIASLGPPYIIAQIVKTDNSVSFQELKQSFLIYISEVAKKLHYTPEYVQYSLLSNVILYAPTLVIGFFVIKKRFWARNVLLFMIALIILKPLIGIMTSDITLSAFLSVDTIILLLMIYFFTRRATKEAFTKEKVT